MKRAIVVGCPGAGKSYFSRKLSKYTKIKVYHLDSLYWKPDKTKISREELSEKLQEIYPLDRWIIDGNYSFTMEERVQHCDTIIFLNLPTEECLHNIEVRIGQPRKDMPWIEEDFDPDFKNYVLRFETEQKPLILSLIEKYKDSKHTYILDNQEEIEEFLESCRE